MYNHLGVKSLDKRFDSQKKIQENAVIIDISDILSCENKEETKQVQIELTSFISKLGNFLLSVQHRQNCVSQTENKRLLIQGDVDLRVSIPCSRCLEEVPTDIHFSIDKDIKLEDSVVHDEDVEDNDYLIGFNLDIDRLIYGEILVNWPMKVLCRDDCKGICKVCGMNLNKGECNCQRTELDPRMAAIQDVFNKFKEV